jgi:2-keto-3-deoxy-L-rhamnonate aldolase RhmA
MAEGTAGAELVGTVLTLPGVTAAELLAEPFDVVWIDLEHAALSRLDAQEMIIGVQAAGTRAFVRLPATAHELMTPILDAGADGIVLADVTDAVTVAAAVTAMAHPPAGTRGWGPRRLSLRGRPSADALPRPALWVQIESVAGIERIDDIVATPGIDAIVVGTADLSFSLGAPLDPGSAALADAIATVERASREANVTFGLAGALDGVPAAFRAGVSILVHSTDARLCAGAVDAAASGLRADLEGARS